MNDQYFEEDDRAALEQWRAQQTQRRLDRFHAKRPAAFATPGELHPDITAWAGRFLAGEYGNLVIVGAFGVGKSWSLWRLHESLLRHGWTGRCEIVDAYEIKEAAAPPPDQTLLRTWTDADLLCIDDVAAQRVSGWDLDVLTPVADRRWKHQRPLVLTSNETQLDGVFGPRIASRVRDSATVVILTGSDRRVPR